MTSLNTELSQKDLGHLLHFLTFPTIPFGQTSMCRPLLTWHFWRFEPFGSTSQYLLSYYSDTWRVSALIQELSIPDNEPRIDFCSNWPTERIHVDNQNGTGNVMGNSQVLVGVKVCQIALSHSLDAGNNMQSSQTRGPLSSVWYLLASGSRPTPSPPPAPPRPWARPWPWGRAPGSGGAGHSCSGVGGSQWNVLL